MNAILQTTSNIQNSENDLREITISEQFEANGGLACYKFRTGPNKFRVIPVNGGSQFQLQEWNGRRYVRDSAFGGPYNVSGNFLNFASRLGYPWCQ